MSEKQPHHHNQQPHHEKHEINEHNHRVHEHIAKEAEKAKREKSAQNIEKIKQMAEAEAKQTEKIKIGKESTIEESDGSFGFHHNLKSDAFNRILKRTQQKLSKPTRAFSKLAHNPTIDKVSEFSAKTIARPSGILGGSIFALVGSLALYYFAKQYGFQYNYLFAFMLFVAGYAIGAILELVVWAFYGRKQRY